MNHSAMKGRSYHEAFKTLCLSLLLKYFNHHPRACPRERLIRALPFKPGADSPDCQHSVRLHFFYSAHDFGRRSFKLYCADSGCYGDRIRHSGAEEKAACYWQDSVDSVMASIKQKRPAPIWIPAPCLQILRKRPDLCKRRGLIDTSLLHHTRRRKSSFILPL